MRKLGRSGIDIAPLVVGGNVFDWTIDEKASINVLDAFIDQGFNAIDTADAYSAWAAENRWDFGPSLASGVSVSPSQFGATHE
jgi:aryl-alcohol dehydrogenase-like predicted oxidoreductase